MFRSIPCVIRLYLFLTVPDEVAPMPLSAFDAADLVPDTVVYTEGTLALLVETVQLARQFICKLSDTCHIQLF